MPQVRIKPRMGSHTEWVHGKPVIYDSDSPLFDVSDEAFAAFGNKFILADGNEAQAVTGPPSSAGEVGRSDVMVQVTIKSRTGSHTEWRQGKQAVYDSDSPSFEISEKTYMAFKNKFNLVGDAPAPVPAPIATPSPVEVINPEAPKPEAANDEPIDVPNLSITKVMAAIEDGQLSVEAALEQEAAAAEPRQSLLRKLSSSILKEGD